MAEQGFAEEGRTQEIAAAMITQNPDLDGIYVAWSSAAQGVIAALREAGKSDVKVVAYDLDATNDLDMAQCGNMAAVALDWPYLEGKTMALLGRARAAGQRDARLRDRPRPDRDPRHHRAGLARQRQRHAAPGDPGRAGPALRVDR